MDGTGVNGRACELRETVSNGNKTRRRTKLDVELILAKRIKLVAWFFCKVMWKLVCAVEENCVGGVTVQVGD